MKASLCSWIIRGHHFFSSSRAQFETAKLLDYLPESVCRLSLLYLITKVASTSRLLAFYGGKCCGGNLCRGGCLHSTSLPQVDSRPNCLTSSGYSLPSPHITESGRPPTGSSRISSGFLFWFSVLPLFWVPGNFPHFLTKPVIAFKRMFIIIYSALSRCSYWEALQVIWSTVILEMKGMVGTSLFIWLFD